METKIRAFNDLCRIVRALQSRGKKVVQCHGIFDIIHPGIVRHLESARNQGDVLVATVIKDKHVRKGPNYPIFGEKLRAENVSSIGYVDYASIVDDNPPLESIKILKPDIFARGQDYRDRDQGLLRKLEHEEETFDVVGCKIYYTPGEVFSSTSIINRFLDIYSDDTRAYLQKIKEKYNTDKIVELLDSLRKLRVLVVGDAIIDEYHYCEPLGKSQKEHLVVNRHISEESFAGGTLAVANHVSGICEKVHLVTVLGTVDSREDFLLSKLRPNIRHKFFYCDGATTIVKRRFIDQYLNQKLFEICYIDNNDIAHNVESQISKWLTKHISQFDLVMICDFGHGFMTERLIRLVQKKAGTLAVNVQSNGANAGFNLVTKYHNVNFACLDESEARLACRNRFGEIRHVAKTLARRVNTDYLIITRGKHGSIGLNSTGRFHETPAFSSVVVDRVGAGDAFFGFTAPCFAQGLPLDLVSFVGNAVGALAVQIVCNREPVEPEKLIQFVHALLR
jgi:bifunctional ADP-heptose synthase (sugar kinase/adenylyltransferase)